MNQLLVIGDAVLDTHVQIDNASVECKLDGAGCKLCLDYASKIPITDSFQTIGGDGSNISVGATKLGLKTALLCSVGDDPSGKLILKELKKQNIDADLVTVDSEAKTRYSIILNYQGERTILSFHQKRNYFWPKKAPQTGNIYYTGMSAGFETLEDELLKYLSSHPAVRLFFTPGSFQIKESLERVRDICKHTDVLIVNLQEAEKILGTTLTKEKTPRALIHELLSLGVKEAVITDAANGAWTGTDEECWHLDSFPVQVVAKTGAGDAFASGYTTARILNHDISYSLSWGIANSCSVITKPGAQNGLLDRSGIEQMVAKYINIKPQAC